MKLGVVDIGSNAIRAVVYDGPKLGSPVIFHSKFRCDLKTLLDKDLDCFSNQIYSIFGYFSYYFTNNNVNKIKCVATEVLRKHPKSNDFLTLIKTKYNLDIEILTGQEEAQFAAKGLISGIKNVNGLGVDFGGGSLELMRINNNQIEKTISIPFGTNIDKDSVSIEKVFDSISENFSEEAFNNLYLIGGTFRMIGRNYMYLMNYPFKILHNITISIESFYEYIVLAEKNIKPNLNVAQQNGIRIIKALIDVARIQNIFVSSYGLKEGVRFSCLLDKDEESKDVIFERVKKATNFDDKSSDLESYFQILNNLFFLKLDDLKEVLYLTIMLSRFYFKCGNAIGGAFVYDFIMTSDIPFSEKQRIMLASILSSIFLNNIPYNIKKISKIYLSANDYYIINIIANFIKIAGEIDGMTLYKPNFDLVQNGKFIEVKTDFALPNVIYHKIKSHLKELRYLIIANNIEN
jgi:exopolyphosphatase/guanosine-5'-triphosphate,3'-diphosphate pyrophosphatase